MMHAQVLRRSIAIPIGQEQQLKLLCNIFFTRGPFYFRAGGCFVNWNCWKCLNNAFLTFGPKTFDVFWPKRYLWMGIKVCGIGFRQVFYTQSGLVLDNLPRLRLSKIINNAGLEPLELNLEYKGTLEQNASQSPSSTAIQNHITVSIKACICPSYKNGYYTPLSGAVWHFIFHKDNKVIFSQYYHLVKNLIHNVAFS